MAHACDDFCKFTLSVASNTSNANNFSTTNSERDAMKCIATAVVVERRIGAYDAGQPMARLGAAPVHDALAVCAIIDPGVITTELIHVDVEVQGPLTDGVTVCDFRRGRGKAPNTHFAVDADEAKFVAMLKDILGRTA